MSNLSNYLKYADDAQGKALTGMLVANMYSDGTLSVLEQLQLASNLVPAMLRLYMKKASEDRISYLQTDYSSKWLPYFRNSGYSENLTKSFFVNFRKLNEKSLVPRNIWLPPAASGAKSIFDLPGQHIAGMSNTMKIALAAGGVIGIGVLIFALRK